MTREPNAVLAKDFAIDAVASARSDCLNDALTSSLTHQSEAAHCFYELVLRKTGKIDAWKCEGNTQSFKDFLETKKISDVFGIDAKNTTFYTLTEDDVVGMAREIGKNKSVLQNEIEVKFREFFIDWLSENKIDLSEEIKEAIKGGRLSLGHFTFQENVLTLFLREILGSQIVTCESSDEQTSTTGIVFSKNDAGSLVLKRTCDVNFLVSFDPYGSTINTESTLTVNKDGVVYNSLKYNNKEVNALLAFQNPKADYVALYHVIKTFKLPLDSIVEQLYNNCLDGATRELDLEKCIEEYKKLNTSADMAEFKNKFVEHIAAQLYNNCLDDVTGELDPKKCIEEYKKLNTSADMAEFKNEFVRYIVSKFDGKDIEEKKKQKDKFLKSLLHHSAPMALIEPFKASRIALVDSVSKPMKISKNHFLESTSENFFQKTSESSLIIATNKERLIGYDILTEVLNEKSNSVLNSTELLLKKQGIEPNSVLQSAYGGLAIISNLEKLFTAKQIEKDALDRFNGLDNRAKQTNTLNDQEAASLAYLDYLIARVNSKIVEYEIRLSEKNDTVAEAKKTEAGQILIFLKEIKSKAGESVASTPVSPASSASAASSSPAPAKKSISVALREATSALPELKTESHRHKLSESYGTELDRIHTDVKKFVDAVRKPEIDAAKEQWKKSKNFRQQSENNLNAEGKPFITILAKETDTKKNKLKEIRDELIFQKLNYESRILKGENFKHWWNRAPEKSAKEKLEATKSMLKVVDKLLNKDYDVDVNFSESAKQGSLGVLHDKLTVLLPSVVDVTKYKTRKVINDVPKFNEPTTGGATIKNGKFIPCKIAYTSAKGDADRQAREILDHALSLNKKGYQKIGITFSANQKQTKAIAENKIEALKGIITGSNQAAVIEALIKLLCNEYSGLKEIFKIVPITTMKVPGGESGPAEVGTLHDTKASLEAAEDFLKSGGVLLGWQNQGTNDDEYAIGGGISKNARGYQNEYQEQDKVIQKACAEWMENYPAFADNTNVASSSSSATNPQRFIETNTRQQQHKSSDTITTGNANDESQKFNPQLLK